MFKFMKTFHLLFLVLFLGGCKFIFFSGSDSSLNDQVHFSTTKAALSEEDKFYSYLEFNCDTKKEAPLPANWKTSFWNDFSKLKESSIDKFYNVPRFKSLLSNGKNKQYLAVIGYHAPEINKEEYFKGDRYKLFYNWDIENHKLQRVLLPDHENMKLTVLHWDVGVYPDCKVGELNISYRDCVACHAAPYYTLTLFFDFAKNKWNYKNYKVEHQPDDSDEIGF